jgi:hypothetical protein
MDSYIIEHWSYSSMAKFLANRLLWKKIYVLKIYDFKSSPAAVVGKALHASAAQLYLGAKPDAAMSVGLSKIDKEPDTNIDYGKTGSRQKMIQEFTAGFQYFMQERPQPHKLLDIEKSITAFIEVEGQTLGIPAKAIIDMVSESPEGDLEINDHKFVRSHSQLQEENGEYFLQAMFNYHVVLSFYKRAPRRMIFDEYKLSANIDNTPQRQSYIIEFQEHPHYFTAFYNLYSECTAEISNPGCRFLPNLSDMLGGEEAFSDFIKGTIGFEAPKTIQHTSRPVEIAEKTFVESSATKVENLYYPPEEKIRLKLQEFGLPVQMHTTHTGASITLYTMKPGRGCKMKTFESHAMDVALALEAKTIRVLAPIMGTNLVGIEVPNKEQTAIPLFNSEGQLVPQLPDNGKLNIPVGVDVYGNTVIKAIDDMPHLLVAGSTGSGKSVMLNSIILTLSKTQSFIDTKLVLIDPKRVEFTQFKNLPNLMAPVITDDTRAAKALKWLAEEMERRYELLETAGYRNIDGYNADNAKKMMKIVVVIDEFADLILKADDLLEDFNIEKGIVLLAQKARAIGIHLIIGTQRPSVDVITGIIKANLPTRISFMTASQVDSKVILDESGAEELIGKGDMLYLDPGKKGLIRLQGFYC